ncbi:Hypothetical predicted protein [Olea europaea subsp. europaea]|uniref:Uncharacterized protein n=1 Tax=Olea europaea subsp. europaea TaxID=158383 RepID=A0A8S0UBY1_OLEEU|nr:Hypothetical predicted protein [Olea europaea subsp. europaea]
MTPNWYLSHKSSFPHCCSSFYYPINASKSSFSISVRLFSAYRTVNHLEGLPWSISWNIG